MKRNLGRQNEVPGDGETVEKKSVSMRSKSISGERVRLIRYQSIGLRHLLNIDWTDLIHQVYCSDSTW